MKLSVWLQLIGWAALILSCSDPEDAVVKPVSITNDIVWESGFPTVKHGATSVDLNLKAKESANFSIFLTTDSISGTTSDSFAKSILQQAGPDLIVVDTAINGGKDLSLTINGLRESSKYYLYVTDDPKQSSGKLLKTLTFTTAVRQDTSNFYSDAENRTVDFLLYKPEEVLKYPDKEYPVIFFLGGLGERATDEKRINLIQNGLLPEYIWKGNDVPMMVMSIQHIHSNWNNDMIEEAMSYAFKEFPIDRKRVYLVGTSAGAFGAWRFAEEWPEKLTAMAVFSGGGNPQNACELKQLPIYAFHNKVDELVDSKLSKEMVDAVNRCSSRETALLQIFPDEGHDAWRRVFDHNHPDWSKSPDVEKINIFEWLLSHQRETKN